MTKVALIKCSSYNFEEVKMAIGKGIELIGGIRNFISTDENILLKPNILTGANPERCITTHPQIFRAISEILLEKRFSISYGDRPGIVPPLIAAKKSGLAEIADLLKIPFADFNTTYTHHFNEGKFIKSFDFYKAIADHRAFISLPKFKTHTFTKITGAVKNQFGCLTFIPRREYHAHMNNPVLFSKMILDLNQAIHPRLYIVDAIEAMEGDGPVGGNPVKLNLIAISSDPVALDATLCRVINLDPSIVPSVYYGSLYGYGFLNEDDIEIVGNSLKEFVNPGFRVDRSQVSEPEKKGILNPIFRRISRKPKVIAGNCTHCANCVDACPVMPKAIYFPEKDSEKAPVIDYSLCIRCYCCFEMCSYNAIYLSNPFIRKVLNALPV